MNGGMGWGVGAGVGGWGGGRVRGVQALPHLGEGILVRCCYVNSFFVAGLERDAGKGGGYLILLGQGH